MCKNMKASPALMPVNTASYSKKEEMSNWTET